MISHPVLDQLGQAGIRLGLDNIRSFLTYVGEPHRAYPVVHVAGTNGKGSVCSFVTAALTAAGYRVGTTLSPHIERVNERIQLDGSPIPDGELTEAIERLARLRADWARDTGFKGIPLTYFEFMTAAAFLYFASAAVDVAVVEVGLGGRLDATNVVQPQVCAITSIGLDHADQLGNTVEEIAVEKAGIFKRGVPAVIGALPGPARVAVEQHAKVLGVPLWRPGKEMLREKRKDGWRLVTPEGQLADVKLGLDGDHQGANALVALGVLHSLRKQGFHVPDDAIRQGFANVHLPGRIETLKPGLVVDGAHNADGAAVLAEWLRATPRTGSRILLFGMGEGRNPFDVVKPLLPYVDEVVTTSCAHPKARHSLELATQLQEIAAQQDLDVLLADGGPIDGCLAEIYREADQTIVAGSLFLAGAARSLVADGVLEGIEPGQGPAEEPDEEEEAEDQA